MVPRQPRDEAAGAEDATLRGGTMGASLDSVFASSNLIVEVTIISCSGVDGVRAGDGPCVLPGCTSM
ncbi:unnamed protein product [Calypogeia fissa]